MVAFIKDKPEKNMRLATKTKLMPSMVCPVCKDTIPSPHALPRQELSRYGIEFCSFIGWCFNCDQGVQNNEFLHDGVWVLYKWRLFTFDAKGKLTIKRWVIENELPVPIVIAGPGGDYDKSYSGSNLSNIFTNSARRVAESHKKHLCSLSARILHVQ